MRCVTASRHHTDAVTIQNIETPSVIVRQTQTPGRSIPIIENVVNKRARRIIAEYRAMNLQYHIEAILLRVINSTNGSRRPPDGFFDILGFNSERDWLLLILQVTGVKLFLDGINKDITRRLVSKCAGMVINHEPEIRDIF